MTLSPTMKYNPAFLSEEELIRNFVVRQKDLQLILEILRENGDQNNQHILVVAPRGTGKTTLVLRTASEIRRNRDFSEKWYSVVFSEESYEVCTPGEFWLEAIFQIGQQTRDRRWKDVYEDLQRESDEERLRERALAQLMDFADDQSKCLLLIVENLNMMLGQQISSDDAWKIRHTLLNEPRIMLLGTAVSRFDQLDNSENAMFELFRIHTLEPLDTDESRRLWESITSEELDVNRIRPIQILTGGNPRLLVIISTFIARSSFKELMENLTRLVDEHTEYFKSHLDNLPAQERKVFVTLADIWNPATAKEIADKARLGVNKVSAHLQRLISKGAVVVADQKGRRKWYQVAERMYNIYHLMRRRGTPARRVRAVVTFMVSFYEPVELVRITGHIAQEACKLEGPEREAHYLAYQGIMENMEDDLSRRSIIGHTPSDFFESESTPQLIRQIGDSKRIEEQMNLPSMVNKEDNAPPGNMVKKAFDLAQMPERVLEAEKVLREAVDLYPDDVSVWAQLGTFLHKKLERYEEAEVAYRKALEIDPKDYWTWAHLGFLLHKRLERYEEAEASYRKALEINPRYCLAWEHLGFLLDKKLERYDEAAVAFRKSTEISPDCNQAWTLLGSLLHERLERYEEAEVAYRKGLEIKPDDHWSWTQLGSLLHERLERYEEAEAAYRKGLEIKPDYHWAWEQLGILLYEQLERYNEAEVAFRRAIGIEPDCDAAWMHLGDLLYEQFKRYEEAEAAYRKALEIDSENHWAWGQSIELKLQAELASLDDILKLTEDRIRRYPESAVLHNDIAWLFYQHASRSYLPKALAWARRSVELEPENLSYSYTLASILVATGNPEESLEHAKKYIRGRSELHHQLEACIDLFVDIAAAGCPREALEVLHSSPNPDLMEPLIVGIGLFLEKEVKAPVEILEIAKDVKKRIGVQRKEMNRENTI